MTYFWFFFVWMILLTALVIGVQWRQIEFQNEWSRYKKARQRVLDHLTDSDEINFRELPDDKPVITEASNRTTAVRDDAGKPAIVHRPKHMRAKLPSRWNPPRDYGKSLRQE